MTTDKTQQEFKSTIIFIQLVVTDFQVAEKVGFNVETL